MTDTLSYFTNASPAAVFGTVGLAGQLIWPLFRNRRSILTMQFGIAASYGTHYGLMDQWSGTGVCSIGGTQTLIAIIAGERPWLRWLGLGFIPLVGLVSYLTWSGMPSLFAMAACCLIMTARMQLDTLRMRMIMLCAAPFGIGYDLMVGTAPALAGAIFSALIGFSAFRREWQARNGLPSGQTQAA